MLRRSVFWTPGLMYPRYRGLHDFIATVPCSATSLRTGRLHANRLRGYSCPDAHWRVQANPKLLRRGVCQAAGLKLSEAFGRGVHPAHAQAAPPEVKTSQTPLKFIASFSDNIRGDEANGQSRPPTLRKLEIQQERALECSVASWVCYWDRLRSRRRG